MTVCIMKDLGFYLFSPLCNLMVSRKNDNQNCVVLKIYVLEIFIDIRVFFYFYENSLETFV